MPEIEAKIKLLDVNSFTAKLFAAGYDHLCDEFEQNYFYDTANRDLSHKDELLRIRVVREVHRKEIGRLKEVLVTFKGAKLHSAFKAREENEFTIDIKQLENLQAFFKSMGYLSLGRYEKKRATWLLKDAHFNNITVFVDELPWIGNYIEIEAPSETELHGILESLKLNNEGYIKQDYLKLLFAYAEKKNISTSFAAF